MAPPGAPKKKCPSCGLTIFSATRTCACGYVILPPHPSRNMGKNGDTVVLVEMCGRLVEMCGRLVEMLDRKAA